jgi:phosphate transporter
LEAPGANADERFSKSLDKELDKIEGFYKQKEQELTAEYEQLIADEIDFQHELQASANAAAGNSSNIVGKRPSRGSLKKPARRASTGSLGPVDEGSSDEETPTTRPGTSGTSGLEDSVEWNPAQRRATESAIYGPGGGRPHVRRSSIGFVEDDPWSDYTVSDSRITLKKRVIACYVSLSELKSYVQLNWTGFSKALKKYDKTCNRGLRPRYLSERVEKAYSFQNETREALNEKIGALEELYARVCTEGDVITAQKDLKLHLREHVVWERNTVWREMIGIERRAQAAALGIRSALVGGRKSAEQTADEELKGFGIPTPVGRLKLPRWCPGWLFSSNMATLIVCLAVFLSLLLTPTFKSIEQGNCLAMLVFVSLLWATEVYPLFAI